MKRFVYSIKLVWSFELVGLVLSKGWQLPTEPALLSCAVTQQHHCHYPADLFQAQHISLPASSWEQEQPIHPCPRMLQPCARSLRVLGQQKCWTVMDLLPHFRSIRMSWARPHFKVLWKSSWTSSQHGTAWGLFLGDVVPGPALFLNREGC